MQKHLGAVLMICAVFAAPAMADVQTGACYDPWGYAYRAGDYPSKTCLIKEDGGCTSCGTENTDGCPGGCNGKGLGSPGRVPYGQTVGAFKCETDGTWSKTAQFACGGDSIFCGMAKYVVKHPNGTQTCADCPAPTNYWPDDDYVSSYDNILEFIVSDGQHIESCQMNPYMNLPYWADKTGKFELWESCAYQP